MTRQVLPWQQVTIPVRSKEGSPLVDAALTVDGAVYSDVDCTEVISEARTDGAGTFSFYAQPGTVITLAADAAFAGDIEPIQVVDVAPRPGGLAAVHPEDTPQVHEQSAVSELVSDASLVGVPPNGAADQVRAAEAVNVPPGEPDETPDGTTATDPDAVTPPDVNTEQETPQYEPEPVE